MTLAMIPRAARPARPVATAALLALALALPAAQVRPAAAAEVVVFAASSLKTALDAAAADFERATGDRVILSYAGSSQLAAQIIAGAGADIFVSAAPEWMDAVEAEGLVVPGSRADLWGNQLVLIVPATPGAAAPAPPTLTPGFDLAALLGDGRLAMALVESVPAGQYGQAALRRLGLWDGVAPRIAQTDSARAALALVALGEAPAGIVYATDARAEPRVRVAGRFPPGSHPAIRYPAALLTGAADAADTAFLRSLSMPAAQAIFAAQGFSRAE